MSGKSRGDGSKNCCRGGVSWISWPLGYRELSQRNVTLGPAERPDAIHEVPSGCGGGANVFLEEALRLGCGPRGGSGLSHNRST